MAASVVASVALPISNNFSFAPSMDVYGKLSDYGKISAGIDAVIMALFANNEVGVFYDPSDLSTLFQDSAGTTPVTADGQPVGLILDKSKGLALGPELVTNGTFDTDTAWTKGTGWSIANGVASYSGNSFGNSLTQVSYAGSNGNSYKVTATITMKATPSPAASVAINIGGTNQDALIYSSMSLQSGVTYTVSGVATLTSVSGLPRITVASNANHQLDYTIDNISVKELAGNHASQATAASRPLYKTDGTYHWLQFDGVDDSLSTAAIDFTSTDKMSVFVSTMAGSTTTSAIVETDMIGNGQFSVLQASTVDISIVGSLGTVYGDFPAATYLSTKYVHVLLADFSQSTRETELIGRRNGSVKTLTFAGVATAGSNNFDNTHVYIGSRGGSSIRYTGNIYSLIVRGALSTTQEITDTETWVNGKTGVY